MHDFDEEVGSYLRELRDRLGQAVSKARSQRPDAKETQWEAGHFARERLPASAAGHLPQAMKMIWSAIGTAQAPLHFEDWSQALLFLGHAEDLLGHVLAGRTEYVATLRYDAICYGGPKSGEVYDMGQELLQGVGFAEMPNVMDDRYYKIVDRISETRWKLEFKPRDWQDADAVSLEEADALTAVLRADVAWAWEQANATKNPAWLRVGVRSFFAFLEGTTHWLRRFALAQNVSRDRLSPGEVACLSEVQYAIRRGEVVERSLRVPPLEAVRLAMNSVARVFEVEWALDTSGTGWDALQRTARVRHRLTHPRHPDDLIVADDEWARMDDAMQWFLDGLTGLLRRVQIAASESGDVETGAD